MDNKPKNVLIIFIKNPIKGNVKTRLAASVGDKKALEIYNELLLKTHEIVVDLNCEKYVYYSDKVLRKDIWEDEIFIKKQQKGNDLGERMYNAFADIFENNESKNVIIIGSDCPMLTPQFIENAFEALKQNSFVIGPAYDGGYYLLGMKQLRIELFEKIIWGGSRVLNDTILRINKMVKTFYQLPPLPDVDTFDDWNLYRSISGKNLKNN
jgi:uncharacterized protein